MASYNLSFKPSVEKDLESLPSLSSSASLTALNNSKAIPFLANRPSYTALNGSTDFESVTTGSCTNWIQQLCRSRSTASVTAVKSIADSDNQRRQDKPLRCGLPS